LSQGAPRLGRVPSADWTVFQRELLGTLQNSGTGSSRNIHETMAHNPHLLEHVTSLGRTLRSADLPLRHRETLIIRTAWNCGSAYELAQHRGIAHAARMSEEDIARIVAGPSAAGWDPFEAVLCTAADELHTGSGLSGITWQALAGAYTPSQVIQSVVLVGYYHMLAYFLNSAGVELEPGADARPLTTPAAASGTCTEATTERR
jgi:4-carboxymuconolactone decarboxylase